MDWEPVIRTWSRRIGLIVLGMIGGLFLPTQSWGGSVMTLALMLGLAAWAINGSPPVGAAPEPAKKIKPVKLARTASDLILQQAQQTAKDITTAAKLEAREIIDRARTAAAALDPASAHEPRVRPPQPDR